MNIFILDKNPKVCAQYHNDKHVCKMLTEGVQMLSTACRLFGLDEGYKITHINHPCNLWVRESLSNWKWLRKLVIELNREYRYRYNKDYNHKAYNIAMSLNYPNIEDKGLTKFAQAMPYRYKNKNAIIAYRNYYISEKQHIANWKRRNIPDWYKFLNKGEYI